MRRFRTLVSGLIGAVIVASSMIAFSAPVGASGGYPVPSNTTICKLLSFALQFVNTLPNSSFKTAVLSEIREDLLAHGC